MFFSSLLGGNEGLVSDGSSSFWRRGLGPVVQQLV